MGRLLLKQYKMVTLLPSVFCTHMHRLALPLTLFHSPAIAVQEARQMGNLQEAKTKLEKQCEELTWRLQLEKRMRVRSLSMLCLLQHVLPASLQHWLLLTAE